MLQAVKFTPCMNYDLACVYIYINILHARPMANERLILYMGGVRKHGGESVDLWGGMHAFVIL